MSLPDTKLEDGFLESNGIRLHAVTAGPPGGQLVILLHGFPEFWRGWIKQMPALANAGYRVIAPDQRGYNRSDKPKGIKPYRINELVKDITGLMDALGYERAYLAGHDWGGIVAWMLGAWHPERLQKLAILNAPHPAPMQKLLTRDLKQMIRSWYAFTFQFPWLPEAAMRAGDWHRAVRALRMSGKPDTFSDEDIAQYKKAWSQPGAITAMINWYRAALWYRPRLSGQQIRVSVPTLILWGRQDIALQPRLAEASLEYCDRGKLEFFSSASHWVQHEQAEAVNRQLLSFFSN